MTIVKVAPCTSKRGALLMVDSPKRGALLMGGTSSYFLNSASNAALGSLDDPPGVSTLRSRTAFGPKNLHSLALVLLSTRFAIGFWH